MKIIGSSRHVQGFTSIITVIFSMGLRVVALPKESLIQNNAKRNTKKILIRYTPSLLRVISEKLQVTYC